MENTMLLTLKCVNPAQDRMPVIEDLQMRICINGCYFEIATATTATTPPTPPTPIPTVPTVPTVPTASATPFWQAYAHFIAERGQANGWTAATYHKFEAVRHLLMEFHPAPDLGFHHFDTDGLNAYVNFLITKKDMRNTTIANQLGFLKWFLRWSLAKGFHHCHDFEWFKPKLRKTGRKVVFLTQDELNRLRTFPIPKRMKYLERVRDVFLFSCFTGLRYSDVFNLKKSDVKENAIEITTVKTADSLVIELNDHSRAILDKYKHEALSGNKALPVISNQRMNIYLKQLGEMAGLDDPVRKTYFKGSRRIDQIIPKYRLLASHVGRRTFVCNALALGIPPQVVMKWTGHSDYASMKPYIDIADDVKASAMCRFNRYF